MARDTRGLLRPARSDDTIATNDSSIVLRRFTGPEADELFALCRPGDGTADARKQAEAAYGAIHALLSAEGASVDVLTCETVFFRNIRRDLKPVLHARGRLLGEAGLRACHPVTTFIEQPPVDEGAALELSLRAVIPRRPHLWPARDVRGTPQCRCEACARTGARLVRLADQTYAYTGNVYGRGPSAFDEAYDMFCRAEDLLQEAGMTFSNVVRTWIYLRDIDRDYAGLNRARREFFRHRGIGLRPASTGVGGTPFPDAHNFSISLQAAKSPQRLDVGPMSASTLGEAWEYGADFSRGLRVVEANKVALYVAGTASVDEAGRTVHAGEFARQVGRMLTNISSLLEAERASFRNVVSAVTYLKRPGDGARLRALFHDHGFDGFPTALVAAPICRPDLLCETEVIAALPLPRAAA